MANVYILSSSVAKKSERGRRGIPPLKPLLPRRPSPVFRPADCPNIWRAELRKKKHALHFSFGGGWIFSEKGKGVFLSGLPPSPRGGGGAIRQAYDLVSNHHALRAWRLAIITNF